MESDTTTSAEFYVARALAAEDLRPGDFVAILHETLEYPSYLWDCDPQLWPPGKPVRLLWHPAEAGTPLKVKAICLPFVFVKQPCGQHRTLDVRQQRLVRLPPNYGRPVWKALSKQARQSKTAGCGASQ